MIQIDMDMPRNCCECPFRSVQNNFACSAIETFMNTAAFTNKRPEWCPLSMPKSVTDNVRDAITAFCESMGDMPSAVFISENTHKAIKKESERLFPPYEALTYPTIYGAKVYPVHDDSIFLVGRSSPIVPGDIMLYSFEKGEPIA